jgi:hypothetical protein
MHVTGRFHDPEHGIVGVATFAGFYCIYSTVHLITPIIAS